MGGVMTRFMLLILLALGIAGCTASGPLFVEAPLPGNGNAIVYIYRMPNLAIGARDARFYVNGTRVFKLSPEGYSYFAVPPGTYELSQEWPFDVALGKTVTVPLTIGANETHFYRFTVDASLMPGQMNFLWRLTPVPAQTGRAEIADKHFQEPENAAPHAVPSTSSR